MDQHEPTQAAEEPPPTPDLDKAPTIATWLVKVNARSRDQDAPTISDLEVRIAGVLATEFPNIAFTARAERVDE